MNNSRKIPILIEAFHNCPHLALLASPGRLFLAYRNSPLFPRLVLNLHGDTPVSEFFTVDNSNFAFHLVSQLVKAFLAAKPIDQDISAYAIQELLKIYDCRDGSKDTHGQFVSSYNIFIRV